MVVDNTNDSKKHHADESSPQNLDQMDNLVQAINIIDDIIYIDTTKITRDEMIQLYDYYNDRKMINHNNEELIWVTIPNVDHKVLRVRTAKRPKVTKKAILTAIKSCDNPTIANIARALNVARDTVSKRLKKWDLYDEIDKQREAAVDTVESALYRAAASGDFKSMKLFLETYGKNRGYGDTDKIQQQDVKVNIEFVTGSSDKED